MTRWPFPYGLLLALAISLGLWLLVILAFIFAERIISTGAWALSLAMNIMGAK